MICNCDSVGRTNATWKSVTHENAHNAYCLLKECFRLYLVQALESVGEARVHQEAWAWSQFQVVELLRYFHTNISLIKKQNLLSPAVFPPAPPSSNPLIYILTLANTGLNKKPTAFTFPKISVLKHTRSGEKKSCLSLYCSIRKTSAKRLQLTSYVLVTFWD